MTQAITSTLGVRGGVPCVAGEARTPVADLLRQLAAGKSLNEISKCTGWAYDKLEAALNELAERYSQPPGPSIEELRERLGRRVREVWITWALEQPNPKPSWLIPWEILPDADREVDCRIGCAIWGDAVAEHQTAIAEHAVRQLTGGSGGG